jgi:hypothetical protein
MKYTLILPTGKIMQFYVQSVAELYKKTHGGVLVTSEILKDCYEDSEFVLV